MKLNPMKNRAVALISAAVIGTSMLAGCGADEKAKDATSKATEVAKTGAAGATGAAKTGAGKATDAAKTGAGKATNAAKTGAAGATDAAKKGADAAKTGAGKATDAAKGAGTVLDPTKASAEDMTKALKTAGVEKADMVAKDIKALKDVKADTWGAKLDEILKKHDVTGAPAEAAKKLFKIG